VKLYGIVAISFIVLKIRQHFKCWSSKPMTKTTLSIARYLKDRPEVNVLTTRFVLTDLKGQILIETEYKKQVDVAALKNGCYVGFIFDSNDVLVKKVKVVKS
jgi:hypothetical protein